MGWLLQRRYEQDITFNKRRPPAMLEPCKKGWLVEISMAAAPGPGPVWFHEEFAMSKTRLTPSNDASSATALTAMPSR